MVEATDQRPRCFGREGGMVRFARGLKPRRLGLVRGNRSMKWVSSVRHGTAVHSFSSISTYNKTVYMPAGSMVVHELGNKIKEFQHYCFHITLSLITGIKTECPVLPYNSFRNYRD